MLVIGFVPVLVSVEAWPKVGPDDAEDLNVELLNPPSNALSNVELNGDFEVSNELLKSLFWKVVEAPNVLPKAVGLNGDMEGADVAGAVPKSGFTVPPKLLPIGLVVVEVSEVGFSMLPFRFN